MAEDSSEVVREQSEAVAAADLMVKGNGPAFLTNLAFANAVSHQQGMNQLQAAIVGKIAETIISTSPAEGGADVAALGELAKLLQMTPPPTNLPTQGQ